MPTVSQGSSAVVDIAAGQKLSVSAIGEAYVDIVAGPIGAGYTSKRVIASTQTIGPFGPATRVRVRAVNGQAIYESAPDISPAMLSTDPAGNVQGIVGPRGLIPLSAAMASGKKTACALGDSITALGSEKTGVYSAWKVMGWLQWCRAFLNDRIYITSDQNFAAPGATTADVVAGQLTQALVAKTDLAFVHAGINDIALTSAVSVATGNLKTIYETLIANGTFVVAIPVRFRNSGYALDAAASRKVLAVNRWIANYARSRAGMLMVDVNPALLDYATGQVKTQYLTDGMHDNVASAQVVGAAVASALKPYLLSADDRCFHPYDLYSADYPAGNLLSNGAFVGTGGTLSNGATGSVANGWTGAGTNGGASVAYSKESYAGMTGVERQVITLGGTANGSHVELNCFNGGIAASVSAGDVLECQVEIEYNITTGSLKGIALDNIMFDSGFSVLQQQIDGFSYDSTGLLTGSGTLILRTDPRTAPAGFVNSNCVVRLHLPASGAIAGTVKVARASMRKVPA